MFVEAVDKAIVAAGTITSGQSIGLGLIGFGYGGVGLRWTNNGLRELVIEDASNGYGPLDWFDNNNTSLRIRQGNLFVGGEATVAGQIHGVTTPTLSTDAANKGYVDTAVAAVTAPTNKKELFTLNSTNIANQYIDLTQVAKTDSIALVVKGGGTQIETLDYTVSYTGGAGGKTRITFINELATGGLSALVAGDVVAVQYQY